jgi:uncharacterized protein
MRQQPADANVFLLAAARQGNTPEIVKALENGANPNAKTRQGEPALVLAVRSQNAEAVRALLAAKANPNEANAQGESALSLARRLGLTELVALMESASQR